jgi:hypothetical protein
MDDLNEQVEANLAEIKAKIAALETLAEETKGGLHKSKAARDTKHTLLQPFLGVGSKISWRKFLQRFNEVSQAKGWSEDDQKMQIALYLDVNALDVYRRLTNDERNDWRTLCTRLKTLFTSTDIVQDARAQLFSIEFDLSLQAASWASEVESIVLEAFPDPTFTEDQRKSIVLSAFLEKLPVEIYAPVKRLPPLANIETAILAVEAERSLQTKIRGACLAQKQKLLAARVVADFEKLKTSVAFISRANQEYRQEMTQSSSNQNYSRNQNCDNDQHWDNRECYKCGEQGHLQRDCEQYSVGDQNFVDEQDQENYDEPQDNRKCYNCGVQGHVFRNCQEPVHRVNAINGGEHYDQEQFAQQQPSQSTSAARIRPEYDGNYDLSLWK